MDSEALLARLKAIREQQDALNPCAHSDSPVRFTLTTFLLLFSKSQELSYVNYMEGAKFLHAWLTQDGLVPLDLELDKYPRATDPKFKVPYLLTGFTSQEFVKIITGKAYGREHVICENAVFLTMVDLVTQGKLKCL